MGSLQHLSLALKLTAAAAFGASALVAAGPAATAQVAVDRTSDCIAADAHDQAAAARGGREGDTRPISDLEQERIRGEVTKRLKAQGETRSTAAAAAASVPVYVHVMRDASGAGDVTDTQIADQIAVMNASFAGAKSAEAADTGFSFYLAGTDRYDNTAWHQDQQTETYRAQTRLGGADALNIWLVDFDYLGVATFPWDYASDPDIDGIRVQYSSLPGGSATNYNYGETATHEAGHWFGLYHTFQGGCTSTNDEVSDTPAQAGSTTGCPEGADTCSLAGLDPIHNFMDYSYDTCYTMFTEGQSSRASQMWTAYRG
jgi:hypothetical protein